MLSHAENLLEGLRRSLSGIAPDEEVAVMFSGGLDSCMVAALLAGRGPVRLYTVGTEGSYDLQAGEGAAQAMGLPWEPIVLEEDELLDGVRSIIRITGTVNPILVSFEIPLYFVSKHARERVLFSGQGADELFAGYARYAEMGDEDRLVRMDADMAKLMDETLAQEAAIAGTFGKEVRYLYLQPEVVEMVRRMPMEAKMSGEVRKAVLREAGRLLGLGELAERRKKAAQYGSGSMRAIKAVAKRRGLTVRALMMRLAEEG